MGIKLESQEEVKLQTFDEDTSLLIQRCILYLMACLSNIESFRRLSGLLANLDKTKVIPFSKFFDLKEKIGKNLPLDWDDNFTLLGIDIDNRLKNLDQNF